MYDQHVQQSMDRPGMVANPGRGQLEQRKWISPSPRSCLKIWSCETGSAAPSSVSPLILKLCRNDVLCNIPGTLMKFTRLSGGESASASC